MLQYFAKIIPNNGKCWFITPKPGGIMVDMIEGVKLTQLTTEGPRKWDDRIWTFIS